MTDHEVELDALPPRLEHPFDRIDDLVIGKILVDCALDFQQYLEHKLCQKSRYLTKNWLQDDLLHEQKHKLLLQLHITQEQLYLDLHQWN